jgi:hypothetical protein
MEKLITQELKNSNNISIKWLGTAMDYGWPFLRDILNQVVNQSVTLDIAMLAHDWPDIQKVNRFWQKEAENYVQSITAFKDKHSNNNIQINLYTYRHMPYWTGLIINNKYLFVAFCEWSAGQYAVGSNEYTLYTKGDGSGHDIYIAQFERWFEFSSQ